MTQRRFIIDTDTASDDAVAIVMALQWPDVTVDAITVVYGNMPLEVASANARYSVEVCGQETPVYEGCARPLLRATAHADWFHGPEGMGMLGRLHPKRPPAGQNAVEELINRFRAAPGGIRSSRSARPAPAAIAPACDSIAASASSGVSPL